MTVKEVSEKLRLFWNENHQQPKLILMEYSNFEEFMRELLNLRNQNFSNCTDFKYNGIPVKRTTDLKRGQIEIYG